MKLRLSPTVIGCAAIAAAALGAWALRTPATQFELPGIGTMAQAQSSETANGEIADVQDMVLGEPDAPVEVIEYASYTCPHCAHFHSDVFPKLRANFIETGKVRFVYREVYFDKYGLWAAMIARCDGGMRYFGISDMLYDGQKDWLASRNDAGIAEELRKIGMKAGLSAEQVQACMQDQAMAQSLVAAYQKNATEDEITATPTLVINGEKMSNMSYDELEKVLNERLN